MHIISLFYNSLILALSISACLLFAWELKRAELFALRERRAVRRQNVSDILNQQNRREF